MVWYLSLKGVCYGSWRSFWEIFEILGGAGDTNNLIGMLNYPDEPYGVLDIYSSKEPGVLTEVWSISWPSTASITAPEGRDLGDF